MQCISLKPHSCLECLQQGPSGTPGALLCDAGRLAGGMFRTLLCCEAYMTLQKLRVCTRSSAFEQVQDVDSDVQPALGGEVVRYGCSKCRYQPWGCIACHPGWKVQRAANQLVTELARHARAHGRDEQQQTAGQADADRSDPQAPAPQTKAAAAGIPTHTRRKRRPNNDSLMSNVDRDAASAPRSAAEPASAELASAAGVSPAAAHGATEAADEEIQRESPFGTKEPSIDSIGGDGMASAAATAVREDAAAADEAAVPAEASDTALALVEAVPDPAALVDFPFNSRRGAAQGLHPVV